MGEKERAPSHLRLAVDNDDVRLIAGTPIWDRIPENISLSLLPLPEPSKDENAVSIVCLDGMSLSDLRRRVEFSRPRIIFDIRAAPSFSSLSAQSSRAGAFQIFDSVGASYLDFGDAAARGGILSRQVRDDMRTIFEQMISSPIRAMVFVRDRSDASMVFLMLGMVVAVISKHEKWTIDIC